ncbi:MAG TPA: hypothetical protein VK477_02575 [Acidobacteriota bacterium]|nr:hypothetical protein [Acidobacteriota bacterium]
MHSVFLRRSFGALVLLVATVLSAADTPSPAVRRPELKETAFNVTDRPIPQNRQTPVDVNAELRLQFVVPPERDASGSSPSAVAPADWQRLQRILEEVRALSAERKAINAAARTDPAALSDPITFRDTRIRPFNRRVDAFFDHLESYLRPGDPSGLQDVLTGHGQSSTPYESLALWLGGEIARLQAIDRAELARHQVEVTVSAFLLRGNTPPRRIGVPGYDNIAIGDPDPIPRTSLRLSKAEEAQFQARMQTTHEVARLLREIQDNWSDTTQMLSQSLNELVSAAQTLARDLRGQTNAINSLNDIETALTQLKDGSTGTPEQKAAAARLLAVCADIRRDADALKQPVAAIVDLTQALRGNATPAKLAELPSLIASLKATTASLEKALQTAMTSFTPVAARVTSPQFAADLASVAAALAYSQIEPLRDLKDRIEALDAGLKPMLDRVRGIAALLSASTDADKLPAQLADVKVDESWFKTASAPDTHLALDTTGILPGDRVQVKVTYRNATGDAPAPEQFTVLATQFGLYRKIDAALVFARPLEEPAPGAGKRWRPNAAATAHWFYRWRPEQDGSLAGGKRAWNFVNPGLGIHAASLAQGDDSVEVGLGVNISLLDGMLSGGYGWNLSTEKPYVYVGIGLLEVLDRARNGTLTSGNTGK